jgi:hypothetical protein
LRHRFVVRFGLGARFLKGVGDRVLEAEFASFASGDIPRVCSVECARGLEEGRFEPGIDGVPGLAVEVCVCGANETGGTMEVAVNCGDRSEAAQALKDEGTHDQFAAERELLSEPVACHFGVAGHERGDPNVP